MARWKDSSGSRTVGRNEPVRRSMGPQILLHEARAEMHIELDERSVTNAAEAVDLTGLDDENVTRSGFRIPLR